MQRSLPALLGVIALLLGGISIGTFSRSARSENIVSSGSEVGRYQFIHVGDNDAYIFDTRTGQCWYRFGTGTTNPWEKQPPISNAAP